LRLYTAANWLFIHLAIWLCNELFNLLLTYLLTPWCRVLLEKLTGLQPIKKFPAFYGTRRFITEFTRAPPPVPILSQLDAVHTPTSQFLKIYLNIILPSTPGSSRWSLSLSSPHQSPVYASPLSYTYYMPRPSHYFRFNIPEEYWVSSTDLFKTLLCLNYK